MNSSDTHKAYRKLKSSIYFDKTQLPLRDKIVLYEYGSERLEEKLDEIWECLETGLGWDAFEESILSSISVLSFPKSMADKKSEFEENPLISNSNADPKIDQVQHFIDMDVAGHILGALWVAHVGCHLDKGMYKHSYGNRLRDTLMDKRTGKMSSSPYLFQPYFFQYESWRDNGMSIAKQHMTTKSDVVLICLDIRNFYGSVDIDLNKFNEILKQQNLDGSDPIKRLHGFVLKVLARYSRVNQTITSKHALPIGFLPSNILSNWCLTPFDEAISNGWNPVYYGRYVDDILIVDKVEANGDISKKAREGSLGRKEIIDHYLIQGNQWSGIPASDQLGLIAEDADEDTLYVIRPEFLNVLPESELKLADEKVKLFYFVEGESDALLECFRREIHKNRSEFRFLPSDDLLEGANDFSSVYSLDRSDTVNKLRGIGDLSVDKYELSKFLGKNLLLSTHIDNFDIEKLYKELKKVFTERTLIDSYLLWERIIEILVINQSFSNLQDFLLAILQAISRISIKEDLNKNARKDDIENGLILVLASALSRALSLAKDSDCKDFVTGLQQRAERESPLISVERVVKDMETGRLAYRTTRMFNSNLVPLAIDDLLGKSEHTRDVQLTDFREILDAVEGDEGSRELYAKEYRYLPYFLPLDKIAFDSMLETYLSQEESPDVIAFDLKAKQDDLDDTFRKINFPSFDGEDASNPFGDDWPKVIEMSRGATDGTQRTNDNATYCYSVGSRDTSKVCIAIANINLPNAYFRNALQGKPNRTQDRFRHMAKIVNETIDEKANVLVLPEAYLPIEWLSLLARTSAKNDFAVATGIEHIAFRGKVYNLTATILPFKKDGIPMATIILRLKNYYSPQEIEEIRGYGHVHVSGKGYPLFKWNDFHFPVYCCFELASIDHRSIFQSYADAVLAVQWNKDTGYFSNIIESWSRDLHCYSIQANVSQFGDSRIVAPTKSEIRDIVRVKGGKNSTILVDEVDIAALRQFQVMHYNLQKQDGSFKQTPPDFNREIVKKKIAGNLF